MPVKAKRRGREGSVEMPAVGTCLAKFLLLTTPHKSGAGKPKIVRLKPGSAPAARKFEGEFAWLAGIGWQGPKADPPGEAPRGTRHPIPPGGGNKPAPDVSS